MPHFIDETGNRYGHLVVVSLSDKTEKNTAKYWNCKCDCGAEVVVPGYDLRRNRRLSCGKCNKPEHYGFSKSRIYRIWGSMVARCKYKNRRTWKDYGGRGITVCDEWQNSAAFYEWALKSGYHDGLTIERIDVNKGYCPENCKWIPMEEQALNTRNSSKIMYKGKLMNLCQYADLIVVSRFTVYGRRNHGWTDEEILSIPYGRHGKKRGVAK